MKILLNYAGGGKYGQSQLLNSQTGLAAGFNVVYKMSPQEIDHDFKVNNSAIFNSGRGAGYFLWKPYFISRILDPLKPDDILFYADSGSVFVKNMEPVFTRVREDSNGVLAFELAGKYVEKHWTKRDIFTATDTNEPKYTDTPQRNAAFMVFRGTGYAKAVVRDWLTHCCNPHLVNDEPNSDGWVEPGFQDHRWDQSIWSVVGKKHGVQTLPDPTQWGLHHKETTDEQMFLQHTRDPR